MEVITAFSVAGIVILLGFIGEFIFDKTNIPDVLWLMIFGIFIGNFFNIYTNPTFREIAPIFTTFALIFILFEGVLNVNLKELVKGMVEGTSISVLNFIVSCVAVSLIMMLFGWGIWEGLLLGAILADAAQAVIVPLLKRIKISDEASIILTFESAISDVLCIVGALTVVNIILMNSFSLTMVVQKVTYSFLFALIVGVAAALIWMKVLPVMNRFSKSYMTTIAVLLLLFSAVEKLEANGALACLSFGLVFGNSKKIFKALKQKTDYDMEESAKFFYSQITFFLKTFFFVYLGIMIKLQDTRLILIGSLLAIILFFMRPIPVFLSQRKSSMSQKDKAFLEVLNPKGLSAAVLATLPMQFGINHGSDFSTIVMSAIVMSVILSLVGVYLTETDRYRGFFSLKIWQSLSAHKKQNNNKADAGSH
jgi:potassium/hydrogen antiporter